MVGVRKREGRKHSRAIGDNVEIDIQNEKENDGFLCIRVPNPKRNNNAKFQQKGVFAKWDLILVQKAIVIQAKRRKKYMTKKDTEILKGSFLKFPKTELAAELGWRDKGLHYEKL